jgi:iron complex transport system permease protein
VLLANVRNLNVLQLGDDEARTLGVSVERVRIVTIVAASLATAVCVAISGLIGFVGLVVPHACRLVFGPDHRSLLPLSLLGGAIFLVVADTGARTMLSPQELPVGVLTAAVGAPFFLLLLRRQRRGLLL